VAGEAAGRHQVQAPADRFFGALEDRIDLVAIADNGVECGAKGPTGRSRRHSSRRAAVQFGLVLSRALPVWRITPVRKSLAGASGREEGRLSAMNSEMPKELKKWEVTREKGKARFILVTGVLAWGLPMFLVMTFLFGRRPDGARSLGMILVSAIIWAFGGALFGWVTWTLSEKKYQNFLQRQASDHANRR
jgi:hypothetical protein